LSTLAIVHAARIKPLPVGIERNRHGVPRRTDRKAKNALRGPFGNLRTQDPRFNSLYRSMQWKPSFGEQTADFARHLCAVAGVAIAYHRKK